MFLKQSTQVIVRMGSFVDVTDGATPETTVALATADQAEALKAGGAATVDIGARTFAAITGADGWYNLTLTTGDTDTLGLLEIVVQDVSLCLPVHRPFFVLPVAIYDVLFAGLGMPELTTTPGATPTIVQALMASYMKERNLYQFTRAAGATPAREKVANDAGTVIFQRDASDDGSTYQKAKAANP